MIKLKGLMMSHFMGLDIFITVWRSFFYSYTIKIPRSFRYKILITVIFILIYRLGTYVPILGVDTKILSQIYSLEYNQSALFSHFNFLMGGSLGRISIFSLNLIPYLSANLVFNILMSSSSQFKNKMKHKKHKLLIQLGTVFIAVIQSAGILIYLKKINFHFYEKTGLLLFMVEANNIYFDFINMLTLLAATLFLQWIGQKITKYGIGNGITIILVSGIFSEISKSLWEINTISKIVFLLVFMFVFYIVFLIEQSSIAVPVIPTQSISIWYEKQEPTPYFITIPINIFGLTPLILYQVLYSVVIHLEESVVSYMQIKMVSPLVIQIITLIASCFIIRGILINSVANKEILLSVKKQMLLFQGLYLGKETLYYFTSILNSLIVINFIYFLVISTIPEVLFSFISNFYVIEYHINGITIFLVAKISISIIKDMKSKILLEISKKIGEK